MYIDTHCHLYKEYYSNVDEVISAAISKNVKIMIVNGVDRKSNQEVIELIGKYSNIYGTLGYHPSEVDSVSDDDLIFLKNNINNPKIVGIGEIGLDYYWEKDNKEKQIDLFKKQLDIALEYKKPVIIHNREATQDVYDILKKYKLRGIIHCFSGSVEIAQQFIQLGYLLGIGGIVTFKNAHNIIRVVESISIDKFVVETDAPYITPEPHRGKQNTPANIPYIIDTIAKIKGEQTEIIEAQIERNTRQLFDKLPII